MTSNPILRRVFLNRLFWGASSASVAALGLTSCGYPTEINPPIFHYDTPVLARLSAEARARDIKAVTFKVSDTRSMEPRLQGDDFIVVETIARRSFDTLKAGEIIVYHPDWSPAMVVVHRLVQKDSYGWIVRGDNVRPNIDVSGRDLTSESSYRVTPLNYIGVVEGIYRFKK